MNTDTGIITVNLLICCKNKTENKLECGSMPNLMAAQPNMGRAFCESSVIPFLVPRRKVWLTPTTRVPCSNAGNIVERKS